ncbi:subtilisin-like protein [Ophiobolus disseminans]|uniref:Subtilisin-like protein n=1 Tax=Ophiobolus disseminans TaxID=1469910 RepID=A0A6A7AGU6_9PLEO|nr:subtilisin-like protein [Ophiobolus disseminans]
METSQDTDESIQPNQNERTMSTNPAATHDQDGLFLAANPIAIEQRNELPPGTASYSAWVTDRNNGKQVNDTRIWLEGLVKDKSKMFQWKVFPWGKDIPLPQEEIEKLLDEGKFDEFDKLRKPGGWFSLILDQAGYEEVSKKKEWIAHIEPTRGSVEMSPVPGSDHGDLYALRSRKVEWGDWEKQQNAIKDLVQASRYEGSNLDDMKDYVYEKNSGQGVIVYLIDHGVEVDVVDEHGEKVFPGFDDPTDDRAIVRTDSFNNASPRRDHRADHSPTGHGTKVASKILGHWGTAKGVILVPVQTERDQQGDLAQGMEAAWRDFMFRRRTLKKPDLRAVVVMSRGVGPDNAPGYTRDDAFKAFAGRDYIDPVSKLTDYGIPIVLASGNYGNQDKRDIIDMIPAVMEGENFPVINVGAATLEGKAWPLTQGQGTQDGTQLTIYAVGVDVQVHDHNDGKETIDSGTSFAAPAVAGIIATHMNYEPWDKSKNVKDRVKEIKRWLRTPESSWERVKNSNPDKPNMQVNMIWNGADKAAHEKVGGATSNPPAPPPKPVDEGRTFVVGLEQVVEPHCTTTSPWLPNDPPDTTCTQNFYYRHFFYGLQNHVKEADSLCHSKVDDWSQTNLGKESGPKWFDAPSWPGGEWKRTLWGEEYTYKNNGQNAGALFKGDRRIDCWGDLKQHDPKSNEWCVNNLKKNSGSSMKRRRLVTCKW